MIQPRADPWGPGLLDLVSGDASIRVDSTMQKDRYVVHAELPGVRPEDVRVSVGEADLELTVVRELRSEGLALHRERASGTAYRTLEFPRGRVDRTAVTASLRQGVLTVTLPFREAYSPEPREHVVVV